MRRALTVTTALVLAALLGSACGGDDDEDAGPELEPRTTEVPSAPENEATLPDDDAAATTVPLPTTAPDGGGELDWEDCSLGFECATLAVPLDWADPAGETIDLAVTRLPATDPDARIGALFVNPGGPGASAIDFTQGVAFAFSDDILAAFDIVAWDPRGVGRSTAVDCDFDPYRLFHVDPSPDDPTEVDALRSVQQEFAAACAATSGDLLAHVGTIDSARDLDAIRLALGDEQISFLAFSYATSLAQVYVNLFPEAVRALVLDGVVDLTVTPIESAEAQYRSGERQLDSILTRCTGDPTCPFATGADAGAAFDALAAQVDAAPIPTGDPADAGPGELQTGVFASLYSSDGYENLTVALAEAAAGDGSALLRFADRYIEAANQDPYAAINCVDGAWPDPAGFDAFAAELSAEAPRLGPGNAYEYRWCAYWSVPPVAPLPSLTAPGAPPILVVSTTGDPATPYENGVHVADLLSSGVLLTHEGDGHTAYLDDGCVTDTVDRYLLDLEVPADGTVC